MKYHLEVGARTVEDTLAAWKGGADRVELYVSPAEGALTPSLGLVQAAIATRKKLGGRLGLFAMIRPRAGDFLYSGHDFDIMCRDTELLYEAGADGFIFGIVTRDGELDLPRMRELIRRCPGREITLHRAFESVRSPERTLEQAADLGVNYVFTGGPPPYGRWGDNQLPKLIEQAAGRLDIVVAVGGQFKTTDLPWLIKTTGATQYHIINGYRKRPSDMQFSYGAKPADDDHLQKSLPTIEYLDETAVRELRDLFDTFEPSP
ncbi:MAG: copper homeostasis protein CutC [Lentisphaeria bacterium]|nr:copper homeostasis protein CutC [Lentisphaeria bacterium]